MPPTRVRSGSSQIDNLQVRGLFYCLAFQRSNKPVVTELFSADLIRSDCWAQNKFSGMSVGISVTTSTLLQTGCWRVSSFFWFTRSSHYWLHFFPVGASRSCCRGHPLKYQSWNLMIIGSILFLHGTRLDTHHQWHKKHMEQNVTGGRIDIIMISSNFFNENHSPFQMWNFAEFYPSWQMSKGHMIKTHE